MTSVAGLTLSEGVIPLAQSFDPDTLRTTKVEWTWTDADAHLRAAKQCLPICDDPSKKELFICVIDQFMDAVDETRLHLTTGPSRCAKFRQVLDGSLRIEWQALSDARVDKSLEHFAADVRALIAMHLSPSS